MSLSGKTCKPLPQGTAPLSDSQVAALLKEVPGWGRQGNEIVKTYAFDDHYKTMAFVNAVAWVSHQQDHHPDMQVGYNKCTIRYSTHSVGGLSENDFICAAKVEALNRA